MNNLKGKSIPTRNGQVKDQIGQHKRPYARQQRLVQREDDSWQVSCSQARTSKAWRRSLPIAAEPRELLGIGQALSSSLAASSWGQQELARDNKKVKLRCAHSKACKLVQSSQRKSGHWPQLVQVLTRLEQPTCWQRNGDSNQIDSLDGWRISQDRAKSIQWHKRSKSTRLVWRWYDRALRVPWQHHLGRQPAR